MLPGLAVAACVNVCFWGLVRTQVLSPPACHDGVVASFCLTLSPGSHSRQRVCLVMPGDPAEELLHHGQPARVLCRPSSWSMISTLQLTEQHYGSCRHQHRCTTGGVSAMTTLLSTTLKTQKRVAHLMLNNMGSSTQKTHCKAGTLCPC